MDVCGAPALTARVVGAATTPRRSRSSAAAGSPGSLSLAAARRGRRRAHHRRRAARAARPRCCARAGLADEVVVADARHPVAPARRGGRGRRTGRRHGRLRRRARLRGRRDPRHRRARHRHLLLDGHLLLRGRAGRRGAGRRRDHAGRQRLRARPRGVRPRAAARRARRPAPLRGPAGRRGDAGSDPSAHPLRNGRVAQRPRGRRRPPRSRSRAAGSSSSATEDRAEAWAGGADDVVDLDGALVTPGFVDATCTPSAPASRSTGLDLTGAPSLPRPARRGGRARRRARRTRGVLVGQGWDETGWPDARPPTGAELERAAPGRRCYLTRVDGHSAVVSPRRWPPLVPGARRTSTAGATTGASSATPTTPCARRRSRA